MILIVMVSVKLAAKTEGKKHIRSDDFEQPFWLQLRLLMQAPCSQCLCHNLGQPTIKDLAYN